MPMYKKPIQPFQEDARRRGSGRVTVPKSIKAERVLTERTARADIEHSLQRAEFLGHKAIANPKLDLRPAPNKQILQRQVDVWCLPQQEWIFDLDTAEEFVYDREVNSEGQTLPQVVKELSGKHKGIEKLWFKINQDLDYGNIESIAEDLNALAIQINKYHESDSQSKEEARETTEDEGSPGSSLDFDGMRSFLSEMDSEFGASGLSQMGDNRHKWVFNLHDELLHGGQHHGVRKVRLRQLYNDIRDKLLEHGESVT